jgi:serine/threonine-protein kinase
MLPERFGRYEVIDEVGDGAMGRVFRAWDPAVNRVVAVKTVKAETLTPDTADEYLKRFHREAQSAGGLNHPAIVRVFDLGDDYLVMEFVEGRTLQQVIREEGRLEPEKALRLLAPVAEAVDHAHRCGIVHRDIKPANVMVQADGRPKLMDFGVARIEASTLTAAGQILGSPSYMSPEQIAGRNVTSRSDLYSLAVVAYEMLTGQPPFQGKTVTQVLYKVMHEAPPPPRRWNLELPARYDDVFARALAKDPAARFGTAAAFLSALDFKELEHAFSEEAAFPPFAAPPAAPGDDAPTVVAAPPPAQGLRPRGLALAAAVLVLLPVAWWVARRRPPVEPAGAPAPVVEGQLVELGPDVTRPVRISGKSASYPDRARRWKHGGTVAIDLIVDENGLPSDLHVAESAGPVLDEAVLQAVRTWRFEAARKGGVRVKVRWQVRHTYKTAP